MRYLLCIGSVQSLYLALMILTQNRAYLPNRILMVWMFVLGINLLGGFLALVGFYETYPHWYGFDATLVLLHGPFAYLYVIYYRNGETRLRRQDYLHFLPYVFFTVYFIYKVRTTPTNYAAIKAIIQSPDPVILSMLICIQVAFLVYSILLFIKLQRQRTYIEESYSFIEGVDLQWVKFMLWILIGVVVLLVLGMISADLFSLVSSELKTYFFYGCLALIPFYILYQSVKHNIFHIRFTQTQSANKYSGSNLSEENSKHILEQLDTLMRLEKPYLDSYLSITKLADMLDIHSKHLSQVINAYKQTSFFNYINTYRVQEVIDRMRNEAYQHFTILGIALDAGFNTKSAFNKSFKKLTGYTPSEYKKHKLK
ncbi:MAG: helix-turn-helix domain-containing protein [Bacteroidota bacterium]